MPGFETEEEMLQKIVETIHIQTGLELSGDDVKSLILEIQREQLKGLVYKTYLQVNAAHQQQQEQAVAEPILVEPVMPSVKEIEQQIEKLE